MFGIKYQTWKEVCEMHFEQKEGRLKAYLQWFPFSKLTQLDKDYIASYNFYEKHILNGTAFFYPEFLLKAENYMLKADGSFRNATLLSPLGFLLFQAIGKTIAENYKSNRPNEVSVYYAGNIQESRCYYKEDYDNFYKEINTYREEFSHFIKTDIRDFFGNVNINVLFENINKVVNHDSVSISQHLLHLYKAYINFCGEGRYPIIENSVTSSYLATIVYLDNIDKRLYEFINEKCEEISGFKMIRYVDDLYIFINTNDDDLEIKHSFNEILNEYSSLLKEYGLAINAKKVCLKETGDLNEELKKSLYDEYFNGIRCEIAELAPDGMVNFLEAIRDEYLWINELTIEEYNQLISDTFVIEGTEFTPAEVFNYFVYEDTKILQSDEVVTIVKEIIDSNISFITLDPKRLTLLIMNTKSTIAIKALLNQLFQRDRADIWNSYDTTVAISYLIQGQFRHLDLLDVIAKRCPSLYQYYECFCKVSFGEILDHRRRTRFCNLVKPDKKSVYLYIMHLFEVDKGNYMAAYAYFKNYFDRITAQMDFVLNSEGKKKPNYKAFYKEGAFKSFYSKIENSKEVIERAHRLRNANPLSHSSAELIDGQNSSQDLKDCIKDLDKLILKFCKENKLA